MSRPKGKSARGLIADDDPLIRSVLRAALEERGLEIVEAASGAEAIDAAGSVDFAVVDARMPGLTLADTIAGLRNGRQLPVLVISGSDPGLDPASGIRWLPKPFDLGALLDAVEHLIVAPLRVSGRDDSHEL